MRRLSHSACLLAALLLSMPARPADDNSANIMCGTAPAGYAGKNCVAAGGYKPLWALGYGCSGYSCP